MDRYWATGSAFGFLVRFVIFLTVGAIIFYLLSAAFWGTWDVTPSDTGP